MRNYIHADVKRILQRSSHLFTMLLVFLVYFCTIYFPNRGAQTTAVTLVASACSTLDWLVTFVGLFEMIAVFSEDFKVKTMQVAIGLGVSRNKVVLCKLLEVAILLVLDCIALTLLTMGVGFLFGAPIGFIVLRDLICTLLVKCLLAQVVCVSLTMIVLFVTQSTILSIFVYALISLGVVNLVLSLMPMFGITALESLNLHRLTLSYLIGAFQTRLLLGTFDFGPFIGIVIYLGVGIFATCKLFGKRELDF